MEITNQVSLRSIRNKRQQDSAVIAEEAIRLAKSLQTVLLYLQEFCRVSLPTAEVEACSSCVKSCCLSSDFKDACKSHSRSVTVQLGLDKTLIPRQV